MVYTGPNKPIAPIDDPYRMFNKLYGQAKDREILKSILDDVQDDLKARLDSTVEPLPRTGTCSTSTRRLSARWNRS